jgi:hypothetical protein
MEPPVSSQRQRHLRPAATPRRSRARPSCTRPTLWGLWRILNAGISQLNPLQIHKIVSRHNHYAVIQSFDNSRVVGAALMLFIFLRNWFVSIILYRFYPLQRLTAGQRGPISSLRQFSVNGCGLSRLFISHCDVPFCFCHRRLGPLSKSFHIFLLTPTSLF